MAHIIDSRLYGDGFSTAEVRALFNESQRLQRWIKIECMLAKVQGNLGIIPRLASDEICKHSEGIELDMEQLVGGVRATHHSLTPLLKALQNNCSGNYGEYIHYGATTQDIQDTGTALEMKEVLCIVQRDVRAVIKLLIDKAIKHKETLMVARTHGQQAMATTFGFKISVWIHELLRHLTRLEQARPRILVVSLSGAVGTMSVLEKPIETMRGLAMELGLEPAPISWHTARDIIAEYACLLSMITATVGKIGNEIFTLTSNECGELREGQGAKQVGSSTMPHKRNPEGAEQIALLARLAKYSCSQALETMVVEHERDGRAWRMDWTIIPEISCYAAACLEHCKQLIVKLEVDEHRMRSNLNLMRDLLSSERLMIFLGSYLGKQTAHAIVHDAAIEAHTSDKNLIDVLLTYPQVTDACSSESLEDMRDPRSQLGAAIELTEAAIEEAEQQLNREQSAEAGTDRLVLAD